jgi:hypothetical protein
MIGPKESMTITIMTSIVDSAFRGVNILCLRSYSRSIKPRKWYLVQTFTTIPLIFIAHGIYSATAYLLSRLMKGKGSFDATFSSQAFTVYIPALIFMWLPELTFFTYLNSKGTYSYLWPDYVEYLRVFILPFIWIIAISTISLMKVHRYSWWKATISVVISLILSGGIPAFFIR